MKKNSPRFFKVFRITLLVVGMFFTSNLLAQDLLIGNDDITVSAVDPPREVDNVIYNKSSKLTINGTLIVNGVFNMDQNGASLELGEGARLIVYGDFIAHNQVKITLQKNSYLIVYGDFTKGGSSGQDLVIIDNAKIYILGNGDNWGGNFTGCGGEYDGTTTTQSDDCDFGNEEDFENNQDQFPDDLVEQLNCYDLSGISDKVVCEGETAIFSVPQITDVTYQWQEKIGDADWTPIGIGTNVYTISNTSLADDGNLYRVIVKPTDPANSNCKISISRKVKLSVTPTPGLEIAVPASVCENDEISIIGTLSGLSPFELDVTINGVDSTFVFVDNHLDILLPAEETQLELKEVRSGSCVEVLNQNYFIELLNAGWTGQTSTEWNTESNWACMPLPTLDQDVTISANAPNYPEIKTGETALVRNLSIEENASVTIVGEMEIAGNLSANGTLDASKGSLVFKGASTQFIPDGALLNNRIKNLVLDNPAGLTNEGVLELTGKLLLTNGDFQTNDAFTLISSATQTALIDGSGNGQVLGQVTMQRYLDNAFGYKYFSSPFSASKVGDFTDIDLTADFPNFYRYNENRRIDSLDLDVTGWEAYTNPNDPLNILEGYALNFGDATDALLISLSGMVNNRNYSLQLENNHRKYTKGFHLVGNPYPSPINWSAPGWTKINIDDQIHFFTASTDNRYTGTYESFVNGIAVNGGTATAIIPSMQGFFVKVSDSDTGDQVIGTLGISNEVRVKDFSQQFYRNQETTPVSLIRLNAAFKGENRKDGMVIYFENRATQGFENHLDAHKLMNTDANVPNFYSLSPNKEQLSINAVAWPEEDETIPLGIRTEREGAMSISLKDLENLPYDFAVFLKDKEKNKTVDLRKQTYNFEVKKGEFNSRFELLFSDKPMLVDEELSGEFFSVFSSEGQMQVDLHLEEKEEGILRLSSVSGQVLETKAGRGEEQVSFEGIASSGVYFVILEKDGKRYTKKVLIRK
ncbi:T9SS type A sorting domain-containing protein [Salegentibacter sediminis]|uniref:T9SS type A sorting domain-containing protein n=1 Tax=Salegentibacter sediminis TaxID=1930251 RepID=UPI0009C0540A|nr:T9SS type A sorting domain-containing protein [Salegentibacter sediminis]